MPTTVEQDWNLTDEQFNRVSELVKSLCGINLHGGKKQLVKARLSKRMRVLGLRSFEQYLEHVRNDPNGTELTSMLDAISTNLTYFFRESHHFEYLQETLLPELMKTKAANKKIRIWSAGCSSGEEPYTLGIVMHEGLPCLSNWDVAILATDLSTRVLAMAREGKYRHERFRQTPNWIISRYFHKFRVSGEEFYEVNDSVRKLITFGRLNLMGEWPMRGPFDAIFCRNVMIYFDKETQGRLIQRYYDILAPGGVLFLGHSESLTGIKHQFRYVQPATYQKV